MLRLIKAYFASTGKPYLRDGTPSFFMNLRVSRRQREDQPAVTRVHGLEPENVAEEGAVRFGVLTVDNDVSARNHLRLRKDAQD
jgi:hypothetical protein